MPLHNPSPPLSATIVQEPICLPPSNPLSLFLQLIFSQQPFSRFPLSLSPSLHAKEIHPSSTTTTIITTTHCSFNSYLANNPSQDYLSVSILACSRNPSFLRATWKWGENTQTKQGVNCKLELGTLKFCWSAVRHISWQGYCFLFLHGPPTMTWHDLQCYTGMRWNNMMGWGNLKS